MRQAGRRPCPGVQAGLLHQADAAGRIGTDRALEIHILADGDGERIAPRRPGWLPGRCCSRPGTR
ncbi:MAG: hypothetical protein U1E87_08390 [Alphaproteobacteria bacterium]